MVDEVGHKKVRRDAGDLSPMMMPAESVNGKSVRVEECTSCRHTSPVNPVARWAKRVSLPRDHKDAAATRNGANAGVRLNAIDRADDEAVCLLHHSGFRDSSAINVVLSGHRVRATSVLPSDKEYSDAWNRVEG